MTWESWFAVSAGCAAALLIMRIFDKWWDRRHCWKCSPKLKSKLENEALVIIWLCDRHFKEERKEQLGY